MSTQPLTRDLIPSPEYVQLLMRLAPEALDVALYNPHEEHSFIHRTISLAPEGNERMADIEAAVYDNPLLLSDFAKVRIIVATDKFLVVPDAVADDPRSRDLFAEAHPDFPTDAETLHNRLTGYGATLLTGIERNEARFLRRTFNNAPISGALAPWVGYCRAGMSRGNTVKAFVDIRPESLDIAVMSTEKLYLLNRFAWRDINDAAYYILAATEPSTADVAEILVAGNLAAREALMPTLRRFRPYVMPMVFPSQMFRAGNATLQTPFDLTILPLCE